MLKIRNVLRSDLEEISRLDLMEDDIMELKGIGHKDEDIPNILKESCEISLSRVCRCFYEDSTGEIIGVYGVTEERAIWFLSSKKLMEVWKEFVRGTKEEFKYLTKDVDYAFNYVHKDHKRGLKWLHWLGFSRSEQIYEFPPATEPYYKLTYRKK